MEGVILLIKTGEDIGRELFISERLTDRRERVGETLDVVEEDGGRLIELARLTQLEADRHGPRRGLGRKARLECRPDVEGRCSKEDQAGDPPFRERCLQRGHNGLVLSNPRTMRGVRRLNAHAIGGDRGHRGRRTWKRAVDVAFKVAAREQREECRAPVEVIVRRQPHRDEVCKLIRAGGGVAIWRRRLAAERPGQATTRRPHQRRR